jgi:putative dehydrogenase
MTDPVRPPETIGFVGLGIMGSAMAKHIRADGFGVCGYDIAASAMETLAAAGGEPAASPRDVAERTNIILTSLATEQSFRAVIGGERGIAGARDNGQLVVDMSTLSLETKTGARDTLRSAGMRMMDCPVSGTGSHAANKQISIFVSGDAADAARCSLLFRSFTRSQRDLGAFGNGTKMKFLANYLVNIHGAAAAEAMTLGVKAGLDPRLVYETLCDSAAMSRIFEVRGPLMIEGTYDPPTARVDMFLKDLAIIGDFAQALRSPATLFAAATQYYLAAAANGRGSQDLACVFEILRDLAGAGGRDRV